MTPRKGAAAIEGIRSRLRDLYPEATTELLWESPFQLLIATILAAQATDRKVNEITPLLFARYPGPEALAKADPEQVEAIVRPLGYYRQKARAIIAVSQKLLERYGGQVPRSMAELVALPGVGRKTAAVVLGTAYGIQEGIAVDTHVSRVAQRLGLSRHRQPERIEADLLRLVPQPEWSWFGHALTLHGRYTCTARKPRCTACALEPYCEQNGL
ncbi:MAG: endonuclease III [Bacteroidetes bacterium]|nr:endonuclease III [Rhodothermia bacterium]MCS7156022.1 endonuclease III [Bacteroidota bacterium]MCX7907710.1 endonuclease III [Bacteroidota bacterium]MDW8137839.1 endonuclease III [Bacteroidota bacterium]MDW8286310.1 endonuclease III [Bacteroidota bacterium]